MLDLTKDDLLAFWKTLYGDRRRVLVTEMVPRKGVATSNAPATSTGALEKNVQDQILLGVDDIEKFRRSRDTASGVA